MLRQIAGILVFLSLLSSAPFVHAQPVRISYAGIAGYNVPLWVAQEAGFFKKHGLSADFILIEGAPISIQALLTNEVQLVNMAGSAPVQATLQGAEVVIIATSYNLMLYSLVVHEEIRSAADLKGKRMGVASLGGITEVAGRLALEKLGLGPKDMVFFVAGSDSTRIAAVRSKAVAASIIAPPNLFVAMDMGLRVLADLGDLGVKYPTWRYNYCALLSDAESGSGQEVSYGIHRGTASLCGEKGLCHAGHAEACQVGKTRDPFDDA